MSAKHVLSDGCPVFFKELLNDGQCLACGACRIVLAAVDPFPFPGTDLFIERVQIGL